MKFVHHHCRVYIIFLFLAFFGKLATGQPNADDWEILFRQSYYTGFQKFPPLRQRWIDLSTSTNPDNLQPLSYGLDAVVAIYEVTDSTKYLDDAITFTNNVINRAQVTKDIPGNRFVLKDNYKGWIGENPKGNLYGQEALLSEIYFFQYVTRLLKDIHNTGSVYRNPVYQNFYIQTLGFVERNIWDKWVNRGIRYANNRYNYLLLNRTHMASHWAYIAAELAGLTAKPDRKADYITYVNLYDSQLEKNFHKYGKYISWNQTWNKISNDNKNQNNDNNIQDVSHANLVISYIVESYDLGLWKDSDFVQRIINTVKDKLWDSSQCLFKDYIDGSMFKTKQEGSEGSFQADGFVKLCRYDSTLFSIYKKFITCSPLLTKWLQYGQLYANLALSKKRLKANKLK